MQAAKNTVESAKEMAANIGASAKSGMEKTKAVVQEKAERMTAHDPMQKERATERKEERINQAELHKQEVRENNVAAKHSATSVGNTGPYTTWTGTDTYSTNPGGTTTYSATGDYGHTTGTHQMSAMPGHGTGHAAGGNVTEGVVGSQPIGTETGRARTTVHNTRAGGGLGKAPGYGTGGAYS